jgi:hypothetical protein
MDPGRRALANSSAPRESLSHFTTLTVNQARSKMGVEATRTDFTNVQLQKVPLRIDANPLPDLSSDLSSPGRSPYSDPAILVLLIHGNTEVTRESERPFTVQVTLNVSPVRSTATVPEYCEPVPGLVPVI